MSLIKTIAALVVVSAAAQLKGEQPRGEYVPIDHPAGTLPPKRNNGASFKCDASLHVEPRNVQRGGVFRIECGVRCTSGWENVYNGFLSERLHLPAQIVISSADGSFRQEILTLGNQLDEPDVRSWLPLGSFQSVGRELLIKVEKPIDAKGSHEHIRSVDLRPGEYYVQAIYNRWLVPKRLRPPGDPIPRPDRGNVHEPLPFNGVSAERMNDPIAISEPVKLVITDAADGGQMANVAGECPLRPELRPTFDRVSKEGRAEVELRFVNQSSKAIELFDPYLSPFFSPTSLLRKRSSGPVDLAMLKADGTYIGDLLFKASGSSGPPTGLDWALLPPGGFVSKDFNFTPGIVPGTPFDADPLPPGKYFLELRAYDRKVSGPPRGLNESLLGTPIVSLPGFAEWRDGLPGPEICRSNRVELEILPSTGD